MKFLLDAQLPPSLKKIFLKNGYDCIHTIDLELGNETPDKTINTISVIQQRVLITKDHDFYNSFIIKRQPYKLVLVKLGNISKNELLQFFHNKLNELTKKIELEDMIILTRDEYL